MPERDQRVIPPDTPLAAERDERAARRPGRERPQKAPPRERPPKEPTAGGGAGRLLSTALLLVLIVGLVGAGWFIAEQHQALAAAQLELRRADNRLADLESRLQITDETFSEAGSEIQGRIAFWESEIRKLWAVTNERNRGWIEANRARIDEQERTLGELRTGIEGMRTQVARHDQALGRQQELRDQVASFERQVLALGEQQRQLVEQVNIARQAVARLESGLTERVATSERAIEAIDAHRIQINSRVAELSSRVDRLAAGATARAASPE
jgi:chromosome segregation ATPase